ncbi:hypothetical protein ED733_002130 [Metarhizium rileyi]|uniref:Uncharacterized protein n=1 Tax=Metarhizium rileyi (strain RCEF 4871) TaxID=1649241 RepID=A0A5C6G6D4_METRR|nr:hypothetical protein ED733_002130 [Metarhizium rileyi]
MSAQGSAAGHEPGLKQLRRYDDTNGWRISIYMIAGFLTCDEKVKGFSNAGAVPDDGWTNREFPRFVDAAPISTSFAFPGLVQQDEVSGRMSYNNRNDMYTAQEECRGSDCRA